MPTRTSPPDLAAASPTQRPAPSELQFPAAVPPALRTPALHAVGAAWASAARAGVELVEEQELDQAVTAVVRNAQRRDIPLTDILIALDALSDVLGTGDGLHARARRIAVHAYYFD